MVKESLLVKRGTYYLKDSGQKHICQISKNYRKELDSIFSILENINYHSEGAPLWDAIQKLEEFEKKMECKDI